MVPPSSLTCVELSPTVSTFPSRSRTNGPNCSVSTRTHRGSVIIFLPCICPSLNSCQITPLPVRMSERSWYRQITRNQDPRRKAGPILCRQELISMRCCVPGIRSLPPERAASKKGHTSRATSGLTPLKTVHRRQKQLSMHSQLTRDSSPLRAGSTSRFRIVVCSAWAQSDLLDIAVTLATNRLCGRGVLPTDAYDQEIEADV